MGAPPGSVVLVRFPFSDLSDVKLRPAVVLADVGRGDMILCQVTSNAYADPKAIELTDATFASGGLQRTSYVRPGKLFTANEALVHSAVGRLTPDAHRTIVDAIVQLLRASL